jgi:hypothetical protein
MHVIAVDGERTVLRGVAELGRNGGRPLLRFLALACGDLVVLAPAGARCDGRRMIGGVAVIEFGRGAVVRTGGLRADVLWEHVRETRLAPAGSRCAVCFGPAGGDTVVTCYCGAPAHPRCFAVLITCSSCGAAA